jgi:lipopolysaccharide/colanic/teichoic acid biosynthesis glycosyltransferase
MSAPSRSTGGLRAQSDSTAADLFFFRQKRFGLKNERIDVLKFRALHHRLADPLALKDGHQE